MKARSQVSSLVLAFVIALVAANSAFASNREDIEACVDAWGKSPFTAKSKFRVLNGGTKVMGIGGDIEDNTKTSKPELILVRPAVTVMAKTVMNLNNPNGWYCLKGKVAVMGKMQVNLHCSAKMASSQGGATVLGHGDDSTGTTVLGSTRVVRTGSCGGKAAPSNNEKTGEEASEESDEG